LVAEGLSRALEVEKINRYFGGIFISPTLWITHLLFVDDVLIFCNGLRGDAEKLREILDLFGKATRMMINDRKSSLSIQNLEEEEIGLYRSLFPFEMKEFNAGLKYLGFHLKPNSYRKSRLALDDSQTRKKAKYMEPQMALSAGRLVLVKSVLEAILVYWMSLAWIPKGILERIRKLCSKFLWAGNQEKVIIPWVKWSSLALPKSWEDGA
jgi:hypothetical protein